MSYRKINVNGKLYEYVVGKVNTKIKEIGVFANEKIGTLSRPWEDWSSYEYYAVTPAIIRRIILTQDM